MALIQLSYSKDPLHYFQHLAHLPYAICLDSCRDFQDRGRFDVMSAKPRTLLKTKNGHTQIIRNDLIAENCSDSIFDLIKSELKKLPQINNPELPFSQGALGYFGYDLGRQLEELPNELQRDINLADACIGIYDWSLVLDHEQEQCWLFYSEDKQFDEIQNWLNKPPANFSPFKLKKAFTSDMSREEYTKAFNQAKNHLIEGDCYQVNLCQRFSSEFTGSPFDAYRQLRGKSPAPFASFMNLPEGAILSLSPERFLHVHDKQVLTQPIKGTRPRYNNFVKDQAAAQALIHSSKDQAENLMIVDLLRNDLSRVCKAGSVKVPQLFELQSFSNVHHLVSSISGELSLNQHPLDLLKACFPGGSITGAPKISAMKIIEKLEKQARSIYCGSIGYCSVDGKMDCNIAIRTLICEGTKIYAYAGGGIVIDSECEAEYQESLTKITNLLSALHG